MYVIDTQPNKVHVPTCTDRSYLYFGVLIYEMCAATLLYGFDRISLTSINAGDICAKDGPYSSVIPGIEENIMSF